MVLAPESLRRGSTSWLGKAGTHMRGPAQMKIHSERMILLSRLQSVMGLCSRKVSASVPEAGSQQSAREARGQATACVADPACAAPIFSGE